MLSDFTGALGTVRRREFRILPSVAVLASMLCGCTTDGAFDLTIEFDPNATRTGEARFIELDLLNSCGNVNLGYAPASAAVKKSWHLAKGEAIPSFGSIPSGKHGLYGRALNADCEVVAAGCVPINVADDGTTKVTLTLSDASCSGGESLCGSPACGSHDGGDEPAINEPPSAPEDVTATGVVGGVALEWGAAMDDVRVEAYRVHRGDAAGFTPSAATEVARVSTLTHMDIVAPGTHFYRVVAEDDAGALGPPSAEVSADALADETAPSIPGTLSAVAGVGTITLSWGAATDNVAVAQYTIHRATSAGITPSEANQIAAVGQLTYVDIAAPGTYYFRVVAEDGAGNRGPPSNEVSSVSAQAPPSAPGTLKATGGVGQVSLSWGAATDDVGIASYHVHRAASAGFTPGAGNLIATPSGLSYVDSVNPGTYYYVVIPVDLGGLSGPASNEASGVSADDTTAPGAPGTLSATGGVRQISLSWGAASDNVGVVGYNVYRSSTAGFIAGSGNLLKQVNGTSTTDTNILGTYYYRVTARDAAGNIGSVSNQASAVAAQALSYTFTANYSGGCPFTIYNNAACGTEVRLTSAASSERGAAYMKNTVTLSNDTSFNVSFRLQFDQPHASGMADGIVFVIRKDTAPPIGHPSGNIGYEGSPPLDAIAAPSVAPSVGVEFDTYRGPTDPGTDDGHIAIVKDGLNTALASHLSYADYTFGSTYVYAWVDYDGIANVLRVYASSSSTKPASPLITYTINIPSVIGGSSVYFGFTGATGGFYARQRFGPFTLNTYD